MPIAQPITGFRQDEDGDWIAELRCGHSQHVRHDPPWQLRPWVIFADGRAAMLGRTLPCKDCDTAQAAGIGRGPGVV